MKNTTILSALIRAMYNVGYADAVLETTKYPDLMKAVVAKFSTAEHLKEIEDDTAGIKKRLQRRERQAGKFLRRTLKELA